MTHNAAIALASVNAPAFSTGALVAMLNTARQNAETGMPRYRKTWAAIRDIYQSEYNLRRN